MQSRTIPNYPMSAILGVSHFEFCHNMLYFTNALPYYEIQYVFSAPFLTVLKVWGQRHLVAKSYKEMGYCNETALNIFFGSCRDHRYQLCQNWPNFLFTILIYVENLLFRTPPKQLVRFSPNLTRIIFRPCCKKLWIS